MSVVVDVVVEACEVISGASETITSTCANADIKPKFKTT